MTTDELVFPLRPCFDRHLSRSRRWADGPASEELAQLILEAVASDPRLRVFTGDGKIKTMPARQSRARLLLDVIARNRAPCEYLEPGSRL